HLEAVAVDPRGEPFELCGFEVHRTTLRVAAARHEAGLLEHLDVLRHGLETDVEGLRELVHRGGPPAEPRDDRASHRVAQRDERAVQSLLAVHLVIHYSTISLINGSVE